MSDASESASDGPAAEETPALPRRVVRSVTPPYRGRSDAEMNAIGWAYGLGLLILLVPLLPFLIIVWVISKLLDRVAPP